MTDLTPERRAAVRHHIALRERAGHTALLVNHLNLTALLDAADECDRLVEAVEAVTALLDEESNENKRLREEVRRLEGVRTASS